MAILRLRVCIHFTVRLGGISLIMSQLSFRENAPSVDEYNLLMHSCGWHKHPEKHVLMALQRSLYWVSVYDCKSIVGMGRVVGDSKLCFYIQDVVVIPEKQKQGIGKTVMDHIMKYLHDNAAQNAYIGLMCRIGVSGFYEQFGFVSRPNEIMGPGMVYPNFTPRAIR